MEPKGARESGPTAPSLKSVVCVDPSMLAALALALGGLTSSPLGTLLVALVAITVIVLVGRFVLSVAWKLLVVATVLVGAAWVVTTLL
ncbi:hypothetical protein GCM10009000_094070 [Halobacterium noricense]